jgi:D-alanine transaminase
MSSRIVYLNGKFLPIAEAHISVMDRGFLFGDGVYEVIPVFENKLFRAEQHLARLQQSLAGIHLSLPANIDIPAIIDELIRRNPEQGANRAIYMQVTRGASIMREHTFPTDAAPTIFMQSTAFTPATIESLSGGAKVITVNDIRWHHCFIKAITLLPNVLLAQEAKEKNAKEAVLIRDGMAMEGTSSNLFIVKDDVLITPPATHEILKGGTRDLILELAEQHGIEYREQEIPREMLYNADEVWMTGSIKEILPITQIDDAQVADGKVGPMWRRMFEHYQQAKK